MHPILARCAPRRRGLTFALLAVVMPVVIGIVGLCVDLGVVALADAQLKTVADAAALAGAKQLADPARLSPSFSITNDIATAQQQAIAIGQANSVLCSPAVLNQNATNASGGDVVVGYLNLAIPGSTLDNSAASTALYNSVQVTARRTADHGGVVPAFFSKALGFGGSSLNVTTIATAQNYAVNGFNCSPSGTYTSLIPIALSLTTYNAMLSQLTTDSYTYKNGAVTSGRDGVYESSMYPVGSGNGNWGTVKIGVSNNSTSTLAGQIQNGATTDQIAAASTTGCTLVLGSGGIPLGGNPGVSLGLKSALQSIVGKVVIVPIYDPNSSGGNGNNYVYQIVQFAPVAVLATYFNGVHSGVLVQPAFATDPTILVGGPQASWAGGGVVRLRLTQ